MIGITVINNRKYVNNVTVIQNKAKFHKTYTMFIIWHVDPRDSRLFIIMGSVKCALRSQSADNIWPYQANTAPVRHIHVVGRTDGLSFSWHKHVDSERILDNKLIDRANKKHKQLLPQVAGRPSTLVNAVCTHSARPEVKCDGVDRIIWVYAQSKSNLSANLQKMTFTSELNIQSLVQSHVDIS